MGRSYGRGKFLNDIFAITYRQFLGNLATNERKIINNSFILLIYEIMKL